MSASAAFVVLTEDAGGSGWAPVAVCVRAMCDLLIDGIRWRAVRFLPREDASVEVLRAVGANRWKGADGIGHTLRIQLARYIANQLLAVDGEARFVFFHLDVDRRWSDGPIARAENVAKFDSLVRHAVRQQLSAGLERAGRLRDLDALMSRLHVLTPCWSIESWLYQNTWYATTACRERPCSGAHVAQYQAWSADRRLLDEVERPKDRQEMHCLRDHDKEGLARGLPAGAMRSTGQSFGASVDALGEDGALLHALIATGASHEVAG